MRSAPAASTEPAPPIVVRDLGRAEYTPVWQAMRTFTDTRTAGTVDELWLVEHFPVYTYGLNDRHEPFDNPAGIPRVQSDRGGQITYHGPGQLVAYVLLDLRRRGHGVKRLVAALEQTAIDILAARGFTGERRPGAPGVYVGGRKIAQLGLRVRRGGSYHGLAFNVDMDLEPFRHIKPCGYAGLETTDLVRLAGRAHAAPDTVKAEMQTRLLENLGYNARTPD